MSSSLRNAVKRKTHKERAQPAGRKRLGLLEKKKDYKLRAADYARKKAHLDGLRRKAELRNEDEFYFGMVRAKTVEGVHKAQREGPDSLAQKLADSFDRSYLQTKLAHERNLLERLQSNLHLIGVRDESAQSKMTVFVDDEEEAETFDETEFLGVAPELSELPKHLLPAIDDDGGDGGDEDVNAKVRIPASKNTLKTEKAYAELLRRKQRVEALERAIEHHDLKKNLNTKGKRRKVADADGNKPARYVWASERSR